MSARASPSGASNGGGEGIRTLDPLHAMQVLSQLSYSPTGRDGRIRTADLLAPIQARCQTALRPEPCWCLGHNSGVRCTPANPIDPGRRMLPRHSELPVASLIVKVPLAGVAGFEPATYGFGDRRSTRLSYTPTMVERARIELATPGFSVRCSTN
jgi:hypothetical protein